MLMLWNSNTNMIQHTNSLAICVHCIKHTKLSLISKSSGKRALCDRTKIQFFNKFINQMRCLLSISSFWHWPESCDTVWTKLIKLGSNPRSKNNNYKWLFFRQLRKLTMKLNHNVFQFKTEARRMSMFIWTETLHKINSSLHFIHETKPLCKFYK